MNTHILKYYDGKTSSPSEAKVIFDDFSDQIIVYSLGRSQSFAIKECRMDIPTGSAPGGIYFPDDSHVVLPPGFDYNEIPDLGKENRMLLLVRWIEQYWKYTALAVVIILFSVLAFYLYGIPAMAKSIAYKLPDSVGNGISDHVIDELEDRLFFPSELDEEQQAVLRDGFAGILEANGFNAYRYDLRFRRSEAIGANAFALPSGTIYMLDGLVELEGMDTDGVVAILAHEIAHVELRHGLQSVIRQAGIGVFATLMIGDVSVGISLATALPKILLETGYSRSLETEADLYAVEYLAKTSYPPEALAEALKTLIGDEDEDALINWISTHPAGNKRYEAIRQKIEELGL